MDNNGHFQLIFDDTLGTLTLAILVFQPTLIHLFHHMVLVRLNQVQIQL